MSFWQDLVVAALVFLAAGYLLRRVYRRQRSGASGCAGCPASQAPTLSRRGDARDASPRAPSTPLVSLDDAPPGSKE